MERRASIKRWVGHPLFIYAGLKTWLLGYDRSAPHFSLRFGDGSVVPDGYFTIVLNTNPYTYLGNRPLDLSAAATLDRGLVAVTFRTMQALAIIGSLGAALRGGGVKASRHLDEHIDVSHLVVEHDTPFPYQVDGDYLGETNRLEFRHVPDAVRLVVPPRAPTS